MSATLFDPFRTLREACDAVATAAESTASVFRERATAVEVIDPIALVAVAQGYEQFAVELRAISIGASAVRSTPADADLARVAGCTCQAAEQNSTVHLDTCALFGRPA